jgi:NAD(P)-dependent dehydrogenase (short-subunit alcohol dehydrogenase family)
MRNLEGKVAFVTGGASGIGLGIGRACIAAGMKLVIADLRRDHLEDAIGGFQARGQGDRVHGVQFDVSDRNAYAGAAAEAIQKFGRIHVLFNNAGLAVMGGIKSLKYADWDWGLGVMLGGVVNGVQTLLPHILEHGEGGHICNTSSMAGLFPPVNESAIYSTAKGALISMAEAMRGELAPDNIGVSVFCPGPVQTNIRETGRLRPAQFRESNLLDVEKNREQSARSANWMTIDECGERVLAGVRRNDLYIFTHSEFRDAVKLKCKALLNSFDDEAPNLARAAEIGFLLHNPIFDEAAGRRRG